MSAATRRFVGASGAATRKISRHRKARAWGVEWARARDSKPWRSSSVNLSGGAKGMGIVALLIGREGCRDGWRVSMPSYYSLCREKTDEGFTKWTSIAEAADRRIGLLDHLDGPGAVIFLCSELARGAGDTRPVRRRDQPPYSSTLARTNRYSKSEYSPRSAARSSSGNSQRKVARCSAGGSAASNCARLSSVTKPKCVDGPHLALERARRPSLSASSRCRSASRSPPGSPLFAAPGPRSRRWCTSAAARRPPGTGGTRAPARWRARQ